MRDQRLSGSTVSVNNARCGRWLGRNLQSSFRSRRMEITLLVRRHCDSLLRAVTIMTQASPSSILEANAARDEDENTRLSCDPTVSALHTGHSCFCASVSRRLASCSVGTIHRVRPGWNWSHSDRRVGAGGSRHAGTDFAGQLASYEAAGPRALSGRPSPRL
jgi:hypothetical protein